MKKNTIFLFAIFGLFLSSVSMAADEVSAKQKYTEELQRQQTVNKQQQDDYQKRLDGLAIQDKAETERRDAYWTKAFVLQERYEKLLDTWEKQAQQYQAYLDSLKKNA